MIKVGPRTVRKAARGPVCMPARGREISAFFLVKGRAMGYNRTGGAQGKEVGMLRAGAVFFWRERRRARKRRRWRAAWIKGLYGETGRGQLGAGQLFKLFLASLLLWEAAWFLGHSLEWAQSMERTAGGEVGERRRGFWLRLKEGEAGFFEILEYRLPGSD